MPTKVSKAAWTFKPAGTRGADEDRQVGFYNSGSQFTDRFTSKKREPTGCHDFDVRCGELGIDTACVRRATHRQTAWLSASMAESGGW